MSANSSVQHVAAGLGTFRAGLVVTESAGGRLERFGAVGACAAVVTLLSIPLAGRLRPAAPVGPAADAAMSLAAAAEATCDVGEPIAGVETA